MAIEELPGEVTGKYSKYIKMAERRLMLDYPSIGKMVKDEGIPGFPIKDDNNRDLFEYALYLYIKAYKKEYSDFIRGISPIVLELFIRGIKIQAGLDIYKYAREDEKNGLRWDREKLENTEIQGIMDEQYRLDLNNVDPEREMAVLAETRMMYTGFMRIAASKLTTLRSVIAGR